MTYGGLDMNKWTPESNSLVLSRVGKTGEECAELGKICSRIVIQGLDGIDPASGVSNREALSNEIADVLAQCEMTMRVLRLDESHIAFRRAEKCKLAEYWNDPETPRCLVCGTSLGLFRDGWYGWRCSSSNCAVP